MTLRARLLAASLGAASLPLLALVPTLNAVTRYYEGELDRALDRAAAIAAAEARRVQGEAFVAAMEVGGLEEVQEACAAGPDLSLGERLMRERRLGVLDVIDPQRRVVTSGHLPARAGDPGLDAGGVRRVEVLRGDAIVPAVATLSGARAGACHVWAGFLWDDIRLGELEAMTGARVSLLSGEAREPAGSARRRVTPLDDAGAFRLALEISDAPLRQARTRILGALMVLAALAALAGLLAARALATSIAVPVGALAEGARAVARGDFDHKVEAPGAPAELQRLVDAFNRMSQDLRRARERLATAERVAAWRDIARRLAHEIKNPLTPIRMSMETVRAAKNDPRFAQVLEESTGAVLEEVERLKRLAEEFAEFARMPRPQQVEMEAGEVLKQAAALYAQAEQKVKVLSTDGCPRLYVDRDQVVRALGNLIKNGLEAGPPVTLAARAGAPGEVVLEVRDAGPGLDPADVPRLFTPYFTTKPEGTGLGLSIVHRVAEEHGGRVEVDPNPGAGAAFRLVLPAAEKRGEKPGTQY